MKRRQYDDDDGRTIVDMNVEGMPWYVPKRDKPTSNHEEIKLTPKENLGLYLGVLKAVALVAGVFIGVFFLVILLMTLVWH